MNEKKPLIIALVVLGLIMLAGGGTLYYLNFVVLPKSQKALADAQKAVADARDKKSKIKGYLEEIERLQKTEAEKRGRIPDLDSKEYDGLANLLDDLRKRAGVDLAGGNYSQPKGTSSRSSARAPRGAAASTPTAGVHKVQYDMNLKGGFHQLLRYLNLLEREKRFLNVESFSITRGTDASSRSGKVTQAARALKVAVTSYTFRTSAVEETAKAPPPPEGGQSTPVPE